MTRKRLWWMLSPLALWFGVVIILWLLQFYWLNSAEERVMGGLYFAMVCSFGCRVGGWAACARALVWVGLLQEPCLSRGQSPLAKQP